MGTGSNKKKSFSDKVKDFFRNSFLPDSSIDNFVLIHKSKANLKRLDKSLDEMENALDELEELSAKANAENELDKWFREELRVLKLRYLMKKENL